VGSRDIVYGSLGVLNIENIVFFVLPAFERTHLSTPVVAGGYVKMASPKFVEVSGEAMNLW